MKKIIVAIIALLWASFAYAQFNGCRPGFCPGGIFGGGASPASILPPSMQSNPPDFYANLKTNQAYVKTLPYNPPATDYINVSRSSAATQVDSSGNWTQCLSSVLCRTDLGASIWEGRTNSIRNNTMAGAVVMADNAQLLTNNAFASQGTGWTSATSGAGSVTFGVGSATIVGDGSTNGTYFSQQLTGLTVGKNYVISINTTSNVGINASVGTSAGASGVLAPTTITGNGNNSLSVDRVGFTATQTSLWINFARLPATPAVVTSVSVSDGERVQNGGFTANPINAAQSTVQNGWRWNSGGATTVIYNGVDGVTITPDGANTGTLDGSIPTASGFTYTLSVDLTATTTIQVGTSVGGATLLNISAIGVGSKVQFTATTSTTWIRFARLAVGNTTIKNVSITSAGALPTNWSYNGVNGGITASVSAIGTQQGVNTISISWGGTNTSGGNLFPAVFFDGSTAISVLYGQTWSGSLLSSSVTNSWSVFTQTLNSSQSLLGSNTTIFTQSAGSFSRGSGSRTFTDSATATIRMAMTTMFANGVSPTDVLTIGWPQLENNSLINSSVASATKASDGSGGVNGSAVYSVGGGTGSAATLNVTWAAGVMTVNSVVSAGSYTVFPPSPATLTYVSGVATGWTGATVTLTPTDNSAKAAASNPILTSNGAVSRSIEADTLILTGLPAFGSSYSAYVRATPQLPTTYSLSQHWLSIDDNSNNNRLVFLRSGTGSFTMSSVSGGTTTSANGPLINQNSSAKAAGADAASDQALSVNGGAIIATSGNLPIGVTLVHLGVNAQANGNFLNGNQEEFAIWFTQRVPNAQLQAMTQ